MTAAISSGSGSAEGDAQSNEYLKSSLQRVNSLLNKVIYLCLLLAKEQKENWPSAMDET